MLEKATVPACDFKDVVNATRKFALYSSNLNQNKRLKSFLTLSQTKAAKAATTFQTTLAVLADATANGTTCNFAPANSTVTTLFNKLQNCAQSAASACSIELSPADNATVTSCSALLPAYIESFQVSRVRQLNRPKK
jgi:hypothetical protein